MAKKLYVSIQTPIIETTLSVKDINGDDYDIILGVKRYTDKQAKVVQELIASSEEVKNFEQLVKDYLSVQEEEENLKAKGEPAIEELRKVIDKIAELNKQFEASREAQQTMLFGLANKDIVYFKNITFPIYDGDIFVENLKVKDTRVATTTDFWETPEECFQVTLQKYSESNEFRLALIELFSRCLQNRKLYNEGLTGN